LSPFFLQNSLLVAPTDQRLLTGWSATMHTVFAYLHVDSCHFTWSPRLDEFSPILAPWVETQSYLLWIFSAKTGFMSPLISCRIWFQYDVLGS
jgi:hypothetical protein